VTGPEVTVREGAVYARYILSSLDRLITCVEGMEAAQWNWRPPAPETNSVYALVIHTLGNAEENTLGTLCRQPVTRDHAQEFAAQAQTLAALHQQWEALRGRLETAMTGLSADDLGQTVRHPRRGTLTGREVLIIVARHAAEHLGQAELTRDLARAALGKQSVS